MLKSVKYVTLAAALTIFASMQPMRAEDNKDSDFAVWSTLTVKKHIVAGFSVSLNGELRTANTASDVNLWWINPELTYTFNKYVSITGGYRYANVLVKSTGAYEDAHRWYAGATGSCTVGPVKFHLRELFEQIYYTDRDMAASGSVISYLRSRLGVELKFDGLFFVPYADVENFLYVAGYRKGETGIMRYTAGFRIPVGKHNTFNLYYRYEQYTSAALDNQVLGLGYALSF